ncbi:MAG TPA: HAD hydrolase family protein [Verrucomicrobiae bacterium]|nr:HAD hydrolase family protein [Verrucomicrobiae bacterium]
MSAKISAAICKRAARVKLFLCDVDGVLTDGSIFIGGEKEFKRFNIQDGLGLVLLRRAGIKIGWVSARPSLATELRATELKIDFLIQQGDRQSKTGAIEALLKQEKLSWNDACFVGDDIVDLGPLTRAGLSVAVANGIAEAKAVAHFVTKACGGHGAIREIIEMILKAQGKWHPFVAHYSE